MNRLSSSETLIRRVQRGDQQAFRELYEAYKRRAWQFALCAMRDSDLAADVVQDAFLEVYRSIGKLRDPRSFQSWFYKILYHHVLRHAKRRQTRHWVEPIEDEKVMISTDPVQDIIADEERQRLWEMVNALDESLRIPLLLHYLEEFTDREIAETCGIPTGTIKWRLHRAKGLLTEMMRKDGKETLNYGEETIR
ncbi:MAG: RNA polymerase sigma factor [Alicyclobacillus sp.]|nr:RNA polymerase sigma factor [Alicyclobacillus sp.]